MSDTINTEPLKRQDYLSPVEPRWCVGCGDYGILKNMTKAFAELQIPRENTVVVSGIGCSSRFPYYVQTYGFHTIHGRAPTVAIGVKLARPELSVWVVTGDGDSLSIGGNHFIHLMRRNPDINVVLFNNRIYGLTKGQASPTTPKGLRTKSTPFGSLETPIQPLSMAIAAGATFVARVSDTDGEMMSQVLTAAARHKGISFVEVLQNCVIFNDGTWDPITKKANMPDNTVHLKHGEPLVFGKERNKGIRIRGFDLEVVDLNQAGLMQSELLVHDVHARDSGLAYKLAQLEHPEFPYPLGIFRQVEAPSFEEIVRQQEIDAGKKQGATDLFQFLRSGETWELTGETTGSSG